MDSVPVTTTVTGRPRRRAVEACSFCRRRKIKCNNEQPTCANCRTYGKDCIYEPLTSGSGDQPEGTPAPERSTRPKNARERRKAKLRAKDEADPGSDRGQTVRSESHDGQQRGDQRDAPRDSHSSSGSHGQQDDANAAGPDTTKSQQTAATLPRGGVSRIVIAPNGVSSYHGRTSALYEEAAHERTTAADSRPRMPDEWIEKGLVAEAARQRQLEEHNYRSGRMDFDSVDPELGMHLLAIHFNRQHHSFNITYRPAFMRDMACGGPYFSKLLLNAIYFGAAKFSPRREVRRDPDDVRTAGWKFRERVRELLGSALDRSDITTIQALLVMTNSLFALGDERSAAWLYAGLAFRMIIDLGMHVDAPDLGSTRKFSDEDLEIRRRVFWGAFVVDKIQSLYQGRPVTLKESDTLVPIKFLDTYEEFEHWMPFAYSTLSAEYSGSPAYSVSTFTYLCHLSVVMSDILSSIYTERTFKQTPSELSKMLESLDSKLTTWRDGLPSHLVFDPTKASSSQVPPPHVMSLHAMYNVLTILLHRPFVADGHLYSTTRSISVNSFITCASAADRIVALLRAYHRAFSVRRAPYLISYATYVAATIHARIAAKRSNDSEAHSSLQTCLAVFHENQETNWAVKRAHVIVQNLMKRLGVSDITGENGLQLDASVAPTAPDSAQQSHGADQGNTVAGINNHAAPPERHAPDQQIGDEVSPNMGWSDIDGIIQSFGRGQDAAGSHAMPEDMNGGFVHHADGSYMHQPSPYANRVYQPGFDVMRPPETSGPHAMHDQSSQMWNTGMMDGGEASIDDLLFGFNSSALDSFSFP